MKQLVLLSWLWLVLVASARADASSYALIVTNNRSQTTSVHDLHYADDDGVQYAELFSDLIGREQVTLLTQLDAETQALHPHVRAAPPTHTELEAAVQRLQRQLQRAKERGQAANVYLVFAGHGNVEHGQGYLDLADGRLTSHQLDALIGRLPAERIHLLLDSCNSYFLLNPRKPGGKRWSNDQAVARDLLAKYPQLGVVLSTSAEQVAYEWSEIQSGVFSYEVRSGLRGAADVDGDARITYAELNGFIRVANVRVPNDLYRPKVFSRPPLADAGSAEPVLMQLPSAQNRRLHLAPGPNQRLTVRDAQSVRLLDLNKEAGTSLTIILPQDVALYAEEKVLGGERPEWVERDVANGANELAALPARAPERAARGEAPLFSELFSEPFGQRALERLRPELQRVEEPPSDVTQQDAERLRLHLSLLATAAEHMRWNLGGTLLITAAVPAAGLSYSLYRESQHHDDWIDHTGFAVGCAMSAVSLGLALYFLTTSWSEEGLYQEFNASDYSTERARAQSVTKLERAFKTKAEQSRASRDVGAWFMMIGGGLAAGQGGFLLAQDSVRHDSVRVSGPILLALGLAQVGFGLFTYLTKSSLENTWEPYARDPAVAQRAPQ